MKIITYEDSIEVLGLSIRAINCLYRENIKTIGALLEYPKDRFIEIKNLGIKSVSQIYEVIEKLNSDNSEFDIIKSGEEITEYRLFQRKYPEDAIYVDSQCNIVQDLPIQKVKFSKRANNCLINNNYLYARFEKRVAISYCKGCKRKSDKIYYQKR